MDLAAQFKSYLTTERRLLPVTVKNYVVDVIKFIRWFEEKWHTPLTPQNLNPHIVALYTPEVSPRSLKRYLSSLRLFSRFLEVPLPTSNLQPPTSDPWHLNDFKSYLSLEKASRHTIKNYLHDIGRFIAWLEKESKNYSEDIKIDQFLLDTYREHLCTKQHLSKSSVSRKLSSIRKYTTWASEKGYVASNDSFYTKNYTKTQLNTEHSSSNPAGYSPFPPMRLAQKLTRGVDLLFEKTTIIPLASFTNMIRYVGTQKPLFGPCPERRSIVPPLHSRVIHHIRKTRPNWYRKYHSHPFVHTVHLAILVLSTSIIGYSLYENVFPKPSPTPAVLSSSSQMRTFVFQGRLTDQQGNPVTQAASMTLSLYKSEDAPKTDALFSVTKVVTPSQDGSFSLPLLFPNDIVTNTDALHLGASVFDQELQPRLQIPTVALAKDSHTLAGLPPITQKDAGTANVVLALDSGGNLTIGGVASPTFQATGGSFTLSGQSILMTTNPGSGGNIELVPDGTGFIDLQKPIQNTTNNNNLPATTGSVEIDDMVSILATSSADAVLTLNQDGGGPLISALANGVSKFTVDVLGNTSHSGNLEALGNFTQRGTGFFTTGTGPVSLNGTTTIGSSSAQTLTLNARIAKDSHLIPQTSEGTNNLGETSLPWDTLFANEIQVTQCIKSASGSALLGTCLSDIRLKKDISPLARMLRRVSQLVPVQYKWKEGGTQQIGLIAQQVEEVFPELVTTIDNGYKAIRFEILPFYMLQAIRELDNAVQQLAVVLKTQMLEATLVSAQAVEVTGKVTARLIEVNELYTTTKIVSPVGDITTLRTNIISPLSSDSITIRLPSSHPSIPLNPSLIVQNASGSAVATIDSAGNASFSGQLTAPDATIGGTLRAQRIIADEIQGARLDSTRQATVSAQYITNDKFLTFPDGFISLGPASITDVAVASRLSVGSPTGGVILADNTVNVLGSTLEIQPLKQGAVSFMSGLVTIDTNGNLQVEGSATFAKDVTIRGSLAANILSPIPNRDLTIHLGGVHAARLDSAKRATSEVSNPNTSQVAPPQARDSWDGGRLVVQNATGSAVLTINQSGDVTSSGSGSFGNLLTKTLSVVRGAQADTSLTETVASSSAGTAIITVGEKERTIVTPFVLPISLIYITATSDTQGQTPYVARQTENSFTVQIPQRVSGDIRFNWWIVN